MSLKRKNPLDYSCRKQQLTWNYKCAIILLALVVVEC